MHIQFYNEDSIINVSVNSTENYRYSDYSLLYTIYTAHVEHIYHKYI